MPFKSVFIAVVLGTALVLAALLVNAHRPRTERDQPLPALIEASGKCAECHRRQTSEAT
jgi:hydroxylamine dehydrogenase